MDGTGAGKTSWARGHVDRNPDKRYLVLGTNAVMESMRVSMSPACVCGQQHICQSHAAAQPADVQEAPTPIGPAQAIAMRICGPVAQRQHMLILSHLHAITTSNLRPSFRHESKIPRLGGLHGLVLVQIIALYKEPLFLCHFCSLCSQDAWCALTA